MNPLTPVIVPAPEALAFSRPFAPEALVRDRCPSLLMSDEDFDGTIDTWIYDFNGDGAADCRQTLRDRRTILTLAGPPRHPFSRVNVRTTGGDGDALLRATFHRVHLDERTLEVNAIPGVLGGCGLELVSLGLLWSWDRERREEVAEARALWVEVCPGARAVERI